ncbi:MAG: sigma-70 family RNA polymerase sigma factor [Oscillospiraceae bacterium]|nr:sigma-70 family RNA polymerase sigma factor [Oscillospiraceae bacterium]
MNDQELIALYYARSEQASAETYRQFGSCCYTIARNILGCAQDAEECVNDVLIRLWDRIPPAKPKNFFAYIAAVTRSIACNRYIASRAKKRGGGEVALALEELCDCSGDENVEQEIDKKALAEALDAFLGTLKPDHRKIFVQRYWYFCPVDDIAEQFGMTKSKVTVSLMRTREKLRNYLEKEGFL